MCSHVSVSLCHPVPHYHAATQIKSAKGYEATLRTVNRLEIGTGSNAGSAGPPSPHNRTVREPNRLPCPTCVFAPLTSSSIHQCRRLFSAGTRKTPRLASSDASRDADTLLHTSWHCFLIFFPRDRRHAVSRNALTYSLCMVYLVVQMPRATGGSSDRRHSLTCSGSGGAGKTNVVDDAVRAVHTSNVGMLERTITSGQAATIRDRNGCTPLHLAVAVGTSACGTSPALPSLFCKRPSRWLHASAPHLLG